MRMDSSSDDLVMQILEEATQSLPGTVERDCDLRTLDGWDSMGMVMFMGLLDERAGVELTVHELRACETPRSLARKVAEKLRA